MDWDLTSYFSEFNGPEYRQFTQTLASDLDALAQNLDSLEPLGQETLEAWSSWILSLEDFSSRFSHLSSYLGCLSAADASNDEVESERGHLAEWAADSDKLRARLNSALGQASDTVYQQFVGLEALQSARYRLDRCRHLAQYQMSDEQEALASELGVNGINAWSKLYDALSGQIRFSYTDSTGKEQEVPMAQRVSLITGHDRAVRRSAFEGANRAWEQHASTCSAALNSMAGTRITLNKRRGVAHFLDTACFQSGLSRDTLDALFQAIDDNITIPRDILAYRAQKLGLEKVSYFDISAPLDIPNAEAVDWDSGTAMISKAFTQAYPALGDFFTEVLEKRWVDYKTRDNKRPGGFCSSSQVTKESRIFMTYKDTMSAVMTLAHEVGHAWHTRVMKDQRTFASSYPMTLAESASTFAELLLADGIVNGHDSSDTQKAVLLDSETNHALAFLLDIPVRFRWEKRFYEQRSKGTVSVKEIKAMMEEEQLRQFGPLLDPAGTDPYFWCSKLHFYIDGVFFYNFPYTFGYLLSCSLFARFKDEGPGFLSAYEDFLRKSGSMSCEDVVKSSLGENIQDPAFWARAIQRLKQPQAKLQQLLG